MVAAVPAVAVPAVAQLPQVPAVAVPQVPAVCQVPDSQRREFGLIHAALSENKGVCLVGEDLRGIVRAVAETGGYELVSFDLWSSESMAGFEKMVCLCARARQLGSAHGIRKLIHIEFGDLWAARTKTLRPKSDFVRRAGFNYPVIMEFRDLDQPVVRDLTKSWKLVEIKSGPVIKPIIGKVQRLLASHSCPLGDAREMAQSDSNLGFILWSNIPRDRNMNLDQLAADRELWSRMENSHESPTPLAVQACVSLRRIQHNTTFPFPVYLPTSKEYRALRQNTQTQKAPSKQEELEARSFDSESL